MLIIDKLKVEHPAAKMLVMAMQMQDKEVRPFINYALIAIIRLVMVLILC